jgi:molybdenum cofactor sulfurtransferase
VTLGECELSKLRRPWFAGGTVTFSSVRAAADVGNGYYLKPGVAGFEDGTVNYLSLPAVGIGLRWLQRIGIERIHTRVSALTGWPLERLASLQHANGRPLVRIYGPHDSTERGATIALNVVDPTGQLWDCWHVEAEANQRNISLRSGCHCNPGAREIALDYRQPELAACFKDKDRLSYDEFRDVIAGSTEGVVRVSTGLASSFEDVYHFVQFVSEFANRPADLAPAGKVGSVPALV